MSFAKFAADALLDDGGEGLGITETPEDKKRFWKTLGMTALGLGGAAGLGYLGYKHMGTLKSMGGKAMDAIGATTAPTNWGSVKGWMPGNSMLASGGLLAGLSAPSIREPITGKLSKGLDWAKNFTDVKPTRWVSKGIGKLTGLPDFIASGLGRKTITGPGGLAQLHGEGITPSIVPQWAQSFFGTRNATVEARGELKKTLDQFDPVQRAAAKPGKSGKGTSSAKVPTLQTPMDYGDEMKRMLNPAETSTLREVLISDPKDPLRSGKMTPEMQDRFLRELPSRAAAAAANPELLKEFAVRRFGSNTAANREAARAILSSIDTYHTAINKRMFGWRRALPRRFGIGALLPLGVAGLQAATGWGKE